MLRREVPVRQSAGLIVVRAGFPDRRVPLAAGVARLGRAEDNEICLADVGVSRRHARILVDDHGVTFEDLGSGNGSWFQGRKLTTHMVAHGDEVNIEPFTLRFELYEEDSDDTRLLADAPGMFTDEPVAAHLELVNPVAGLRNSYGIGAQGLTLGRSEQRDIIIPDPAASRLHCEIVKVGGEYWAKDTGAANGLFVNEQRIRERHLRDGDVIRIGATEFRFTCVGEDRGTDVLETAEPEHTEAFAGIVEAPPPPPPGTALPPPPMNGGLAAPTWGAPAEAPPLGAPAGGFGAPAPFGEAPAGPAPAAFGGADLGGGAPSPGKGAGITPIRLAIGAILALTVIMVGIKKGGEFLESSSGPTVVSKSADGYEHEAAGVDAEDQAEVDGLMDEGMELFMDEEYYAATSRFLQVLKVDPGHEDAERMGYLACEFISIGAMHAVVQQAAASEADKSEAKSAALEATEAALAGKGSVSNARDLVRAALRLIPDDAELSDADTALGRKAGAISRRATERKHEKLSEEIGPMFDNAKAQLDRGDWVNAIAGFQAVMAADTSKSTEYYYQASDGINDAKSRMRRAAATPYKEAMTSMNRGDNLTARSKLRETLRLDPYHSAAKQKLSEVQGRLESEASDKFKEARVLEAANQVERALSLYSQVQKLVGDKSHELHKLAQQRIDALLR
ncbi:MAG: FHA domain-containing protein [Proteobacteria bacterium]|nr:FHA domain-containing protein [Pseudomonadota bacterium]MCP4920790.1 FHA domain-containing protein [Pseudomonadota bacterium]